MILQINILNNKTMKKIVFYFIRTSFPFISVWSQKQPVDELFRKI